MNPINTNSYLSIPSYYRPIASSHLPVQDGVGKSASIGESFGKMVQEVDVLQKQAESTVQEFALGKKDILAVSMAINKADIGLKLAVEVRNKAVEAYQEIMRTTM